MVKVLKQINYDKTEKNDIENIILQYLYDTLFKPIIEANHISQKKIRNNAPNPLKEAIKTGKIYYEDGKFKGKFNAKISKELTELGAKYNSASKTFSIPKSKLPSNIQIAIIQKFYQEKAIADKTIKIIDNINSDTVDNLAFTPEYEKITSDLKISIDDTVKDFAVLPTLKTQSVKQIAEAYSENLKLYIKKFTDEEILKLREEVIKITQEGFRREKLVSLIQERYGVSKHKAKFLAKQETSLLTAQYTKARYQEAGIKKFQWTRSHAKKPDKFHEKYYGKIFDFNNPPIIDERTGQKGLPGERFGCSCGLRAVIE